MRDPSWANETENVQFDPLSFIKYIKNTGRAYQRQAMELLNTYRLFAEAFSQEEQHYAIFNM